jgi:hypothetical protein
MANEARIRAFMLPVLTLDADYDPGSDTSISAPELADWPEVTATAHLPVWINRDGDGGNDPYLRYITAHTLSATTATIGAAPENIVTPYAVSAGVAANHGHTPRDFPGPWVKVTNAANLDYSLSTWGDLSASLDVVLDPVYEGDFVEIAWDFSWNNDAANAFFDVHSRNGAASRVWSIDAAENASGQGLQGAWGPPGTYAASNGRWGRAVLATELSSGTLTLRGRRRNATAVLSRINGSANLLFMLKARNTGPVPEEPAFV